MWIVFQLQMTKKRISEWFTHFIRKSLVEYFPRSKKCTVMFGDQGFKEKGKITVVFKSKYLTRMKKVKP